MSRFVVEPHQVENRRVKVVNMDSISRATRMPYLIGFPIDRAPRTPAPASREENTQ